MKYRKSDLEDAKLRLEQTPPSMLNERKWLEHRIAEIENYLLGRKHRRDLRKEKKLSTPPTQGISQDSEVDFILKFSKSVLADQAVKLKFPRLLTTKLVIKDIQVSKARERRGVLSITYSTRNMKHYQSNDFKEYATVNWVISHIRNRQGQNALQLLALHEIAHIISYVQKINDHHGPTFQRIYSELLKTYFKEVAQEASTSQATPTLTEAPPPPLVWFHGRDFLRDIALDLDDYYHGTSKDLTRIPKLCEAHGLIFQEYTNKPKGFKCLFKDQPYQVSMTSRRIQLKQIR